LRIEHQAVDAEEMIVFEVASGAFRAEEVNTMVEEADVKSAIRREGQGRDIAVGEGPGFRWECRYPTSAGFAKERATGQGIECVGRRKKGVNSLE
jgi:hypothetical protein